MSEQGFLEVKNWSEFQHYRNRDPLWIKLYRRVLTDYAFSRLQDASKMHLVGIWLVASEFGGRVPYDPEWIARRINATEPVDLQVLVDAGFLSLARRKRDASKPPAERLPRDRDRERDIAGPQKASRDTWLTPFSDAWTTHRGKPPFGRLARVLRPVVEEHGHRQAFATWAGYLEERRGKGFCAPEDFAGHYEHYRRKWGVEIGEDGSEIPIPDEPMVAA